MANTANSNAIRTNLNLDPYFDDFDKTKNFHRLLFRPGFPVQARELTQSQTILQNQVSRFADHIFQNGTVVIPGHFNIEKDVPYVKVNDLDNAGTEVEISTWVGKTVTGATTGISAIITDVLDGSEGLTNKKTIYVRYLSSSTVDNTTRVFQPDEVLNGPDGSTLVVFSSEPTGYACKFSITEGVLYAKEHFIYFPSQSIIVGRYTINPSAKVGFIVEESIVTYETDQSLLDPAVGSSNYGAPGANRLKLYPSLEVYDYDAVTGNDFNTLFTIKEGVVDENLERTQYAIIRDELAKRTYDESGDYYVNGLGIRIREHLDTGSNFGYSNTGNSQLLAIGVEPGTAYVKGYEINKLATDWVLINKGITYSNVNSQIATSSMGNYILVDECVGSATLDQGLEIQLYSQPRNRISNGLWSTSPAGQNVGTAKVKGFEYNSGIQGTANANYKLYLNDIRMFGSNSFADINGVYYNHASISDFGADTVLEDGDTVLKGTETNPMLYFVGSNYTRDVKDTTGTSDTTFTFKRTENVTIGTNGTFSIAISTSSEATPYGTATLDSTQIKDLIVVMNENINVATGLTGTATNGTNYISATTPNSKLNVGDKITLANMSTLYTITSVTATFIFVSPNLTANASSNAITKVYKNGEILELNKKGINGSNIAVTSTSSTISVDLKETFPTTVSSTISYPVTRSTAREVAKTLRPDRFVKINVASANTVAGAYNLGFSDVYRIKEIRVHNSPFTSATDGSNVTTSFTWTTGQKDDMYDFATIKPKNLTLSSGQHILVKLDYFIPDFSQGVGYFSIDSYPIDDSNTSNTTIKTENIPIYRSPTTGKEYNLRNYLDYRPVKSSTATDSTTVAGASTNPVETSTFLSEVNGLRIPKPSEQITYDYSYYLSRRDLVCLDTAGNVRIIKGIPSSYPVTPTAPENFMTLAKLFITPYPSLSPIYAKTINRKDLSATSTKVANIRLTMRDLGVLKDRIGNLEYYTALNALEKNAIDYKILDENGLDRFKNGIFVDNFIDHSLGATNDPDYRIVVDPIEKSIRPVYTMDSIYYGLLANTNVVINKNLATLSYSDVAFITQNNATSFRSTETATYKFIGNLYLSPETDVWVDTEQLADQHVVIGESTNTPASSSVVTWNQWQTQIVGYNIYDATTGALLQSMNEATSAATAVATAQSLSDQRGVAVNLETLIRNARTGVLETSTVATDSQRLGNKVVDVSVNPYIRPQFIHLYARGLKANTKYYTYFDNEDMSEYVTPYSPTAQQKSLVYSVLSTETGALNPFDPQFINLGISSANEGSSLVSTANGEVFGVLRLPSEKPFRIGTKEVKLVDTFSTSAEDATSYATDYFVASGIVQQKQDTILTTRQVVKTSSGVGQSYSTTSTARVEPTPVSVIETDTGTGGGGFNDLDGGQGGAGCMAYSFVVRTPENVEGLFLTGVDLYCASKDANLGVWFEILEMDSAGGVTSTQVPFSEIWYTSDQVTTTDDATTPFRVTFPAPVFLYKDKSYALAIHPEALNPNYYFWVSRIGETDVVTGQKVTSRKYTGTLYITNNGLNWDIVNGVDLTCKFYRASFTSNTTGTLVLGNKPVEKLALSNTSAVMSYYGENIIEDDKITLSSITGGTIVVGDIIIGTNSGANSAVSAINGSTYTMSNTGYTVGETANVYFSANMVSRGITATISSKTTPTGTLSQYKTYDGNVTVKLTGSNGTFYTGRTIRGAFSGHNATVDAIQNYRYSVVDFEPSMLKFTGTSLNWEMQTTSNTGTKGTYFRIDDNNNYFFDEEKAILGRTNENNSLSGLPSNNVKASLYTTSDYISPVVDIGRTHSIYVDNIVNSNTSGETNASGGVLINKYISGIVTLADGQDAEDMKVILTGYRPPSTEIHVYAKILNNEDGNTEGFASREWIELENSNPLYSSLSDRDDFKEYTFGFPASYLNTNGVVEYTNSDGSTFAGYKHFAIKIGLSATNSAVVPRVGDLMVFAVQA